MLKCLITVSFIVKYFKCLCGYIRAKLNFTYCVKLKCVLYVSYEHPFYSYVVKLNNYYLPIRYKCEIHLKQSFTLLVDCIKQFTNVVYYFILRVTIHANYEVHLQDMQHLFLDKCFVIP